VKVELRVLKKEDIHILQALLVRCSDYLIFQDEEAVKPSAAQDLLNDRPVGIEDKDKVILGIFINHKQLTGVFELIKSYAGPRTLSLALMLIAPSDRGHGIGNKAYQLVEDWAISQRFNKVRLGVLFGNEKGLKFWKSMGYIKTGEVKTQMRPNLSKKVMVLEKSIVVSDPR